jgi:uncharacterized membrane protein (UPF0127 family)
MATLINKTKNQVVISEVEIARSFFARGRGLLGRSSLGEFQALWIPRCNSIHTFFMKFSIDCVFVDKNLKVRAIYSDVRPGRILLPVWGAASVFEFAAGMSQKLNISVGDQLYVGT